MLGNTKYAIFPGTSSNARAGTVVGQGHDKRCVVEAVSGQPAYASTSNLREGTKDTSNPPPPTASSLYCYTEIITTSSLVVYTKYIKASK